MTQEQFGILSFIMSNLSFFMEIFVISLMLTLSNDLPSGNTRSLFENNKNHLSDAVWCFYCYEFHLFDCFYCWLKTNLFLAARLQYSEATKWSCYENEGEVVNKSKSLNVGQICFKPFNAWSPLKGHKKCVPSKKQL